MRYCGRMIMLCTCLFGVSVMSGRMLFAQCSQDCKRVTCHSMPQPPQNNFVCALIDPYICWSSIWVRNPTYGACTQSELNYQVAKCPDCNPECTNDPSEAADCVAQTPGCEPGVDCCEPPATNPGRRDCLLHSV